MFPNLTDLVQGDFAQPRRRENITKEFERKASKLGFEFAP